MIPSMTSRFRFKIPVYISSLVQAVRENPLYLESYRESTPLTMGNYCTTEH